MTATRIVRPAGVATPLLTMPGFFSVEINGAWMPTIVEGKHSAMDLLDAHTPQTTRTLPSGEVPTPGLAVSVPAATREAVTCEVTAGDYFRSP